MTKEKLEQVITDLEKGCKDLRDSKGLDYASEQDALKNFKEIGEQLKMTPKAILGVYLNKHISSINNYISGEKETEPIEERIKDTINYLKLLHCLNVEEKETNS